MAIFTLRSGNDWSVIDVAVAFVLDQCELTSSTFCPEVVITRSRTGKAGKSSSCYYEIIVAIPSQLSIN